MIKIEITEDIKHYFIESSQIKSFIFYFRKIENMSKGEEEEEEEEERERERENLKLAPCSVQIPTQGSSHNPGIMT